MSGEPGLTPLEGKSIAELEAMEHDLRQRLNVVCDTIRTLKIAKCPAQIGAVVTYDGQEFKVVAVEPKWGDRYWLTGVPKLKSGEWGRAQRHLYSGWFLSSSSERK